MHRKRNSSLGVGLACLLLLWGTSFSPSLAGSSGSTGQSGQTGTSGQGGPTLTTSLLVNGAAATCGATVASGDAVCVRFSSDQTGTAVVTARKGTGADTTLASGSVQAGVTYRVCVTAGTADGQMRTFTVTVTNTSGQASSQECTFTVGSSSAQGGPTVTTSLLVNGAAADCGATVAAGNQVCVRFSSDQTGTAVVTVRKGTGAETTLASGSVQAGVTYRVCVTAGAADGQTRTFTVTVTNTSGQATSQECAYVVQ
jgi:collagen type VII alpha